MAQVKFPESIKLREIKKANHVRATFTGSSSHFYVTMEVVASNNNTLFLRHTKANRHADVIYQVRNVFDQWQEYKIINNNDRVVVDF